MTGAAAQGLVAEPGGAAVLLRVRVQPNARRAAAAGSWNGLLKLAIPAPPTDGRANEAAALLLGELFGLRPSSIALVRGHSSRTKVFRLALPLSVARARLEQLVRAFRDR